jgi:hypothetical protein
MELLSSIKISPVTIREMNIAKRKYILVRAGVIVIKCEMIIDTTIKSYHLPADLVRKLHIPRGSGLSMRYDAQEHLLHLGPIVGILTTFLPTNDGHEPTSIHAELIYLSNITKTLPGLFFFFTPSGIDWDNHTVRGYNNRLTGNDHRGAWVSSVYPIPDVIYDRVSSRHSEARESMVQTKKKLNQLPYIKYFNPSFLNKWKVHTLLNQNRELHPYLPETLILNQANLSYMLSKYNMLYLKPSNGSLGWGIIKVRKNEKGTLSFSFARRRRYRSEAENAADLMIKTSKFRKNKPYIVQQGISLAKYKGNHFDIRIIYQKNGSGEWQVSKKFIRVAAPGSAISNLSGGGQSGNI